MRAWFDKQLRSAVEVIDEEFASSGSSPVFLAVVAAAFLGVLAAVAYVPPLSTASQFRDPWVSILLVLIGTSLTATAHRCTFHTTIGAVCTLLDNAFYSSALAFAAVNTQGTTSIALVIVHAAMVLAFPAQGYGLSLFFGLAMTLPLLGLLVVYQPPALITIVLLSTAIMTLALSALTRNRVVMKAQHRRLQKALGAAEQVAEGSMQAALGTTLLSLGHFLHELRNLQTAASTNLTFLELNASLDEDNRAALADARLAQDRCTKLVVDTVESLKKRAADVNTVFSLQDQIAQVVRDTQRVNILAEGGDPCFVLSGNPEHLTAVLENLVRNAIQAGARNIRISTQVAASGQAALVVVHDDGPGIAESQRGQLFEAFTESTKIGGTGLGLYLCRRYVGLFGGTIEAGEGPLGGAAFQIHLPGRVVGRRRSSSRSPAPRAQSA